MRSHRRPPPARANVDVGFAATGGALLLGNIVTLVVAPSRPRPALTVDTGANDVMLRLPQPGFEPPGRHNPD